MYTIHNDDKDLLYYILLFFACNIHNLIYDPDPKTSHKGQICEIENVAIIIISNYVPTGCNKCLVCNGFYCFCVVAPGHGITMHWIAGHSEHASLLRTMSFVKTNAFQKGGA